MSNDKFWNYYYKYIDYNGKNVICSINRAKIINKSFYYPVIVSLLDNDIIFSISPQYYNDLYNIIINQKLFEKKQIINVLKLYFNTKVKNFTIKEMNRMYKDINKNIDSSDVVEINNNYKNEYFNSFKLNKSIDYKENKWNNLLSYKFLKGIIKDSKIVSMGYISDIEYNGGNIIIQTIDEYQNKGYATYIVEKLSEDLLKNMILPIYWVESKNIHSIKLAESLGFRNMVTEIVVSIPVINN